MSVLLVLPEGDDEALKTYTAFAAGYDDVSFAHSTNPEHGARNEVSGKYGMVVFRSFDEGHKVLSEDTPLTAE